MMERSIDTSQNFQLSGPQILKRRLDWNRPEHRLIAYACLVQAVYVLQADKEYSRTTGLAPLWWKSVNYELLESILNEKGSHVIGAIYKWQGVSFFKPRSAPLVVVAFRGTVLDSETTSSDMAINMRIISNKLHETSRFQVAFLAVTRMVAAYRPGNVCIVGHSLGAAVGLLVGRRMAEEGCYLEAHFFNPPFASLPLEMALGTSVFSHQLKLLHIFIAAALAFILGDLQSGSRQVREPAKSVGDWSPHLYINANDAICSSYLDYFSLNTNLMIPFDGVLLPFSRPYSIRGLLYLMSQANSRPYHLIPSAKLHVSYTKFDAALAAHFISSWWSTKTVVHTVISAVSNEFQVSSSKGL